MSKANQVTEENAGKLAEITQKKLEKVQGITQELIEFDIKKNQEEVHSLT